MKRVRLLGVLVIAVHWVTAVWHLVLLTKIFPNDGTDWLPVPIALVSAVHLGLSIVWWTASIRVAGWVMLVVLGAALGAGTYEHFLGPGQNTIFRIPRTDWTPAFLATVFVLLVFEILGCCIGVRLARSKPGDKNESATLTRVAT